MKKYLSFFLYLFCIYLIFSNEWKINYENDDMFFKDNQNHVISVITNLDLNEELVSFIGDYLSKIWDIPQLKGNLGSVVIDGNNNKLESFRFVIKPSECKFKKIDLAAFMPSGMSFSYKKNENDKFDFFYEIIVCSKNKMPKISSVFSSSAEMLEHIYAAAMMPELYVEKYVDEQVTRLENAMYLLKNNKLKDSQQIINSNNMIAIYNLLLENQNISCTEIINNLVTKNIFVTTAEVDAVCIISFGKLPKK